jgi:hypothetical protein
MYTSLFVVLKTRISKYILTSFNFGPSTERRMTFVSEFAHIRPCSKYYALSDADLPHLEVPSIQIGSTCEWYNWIGLEKDINHYRF